MHFFTTNLSTYINLTVNNPRGNISIVAMEYAPILVFVLEMLYAVCHINFTEFMIIYNCRKRWTYSRNHLPQAYRQLSVSAHTILLCLAISQTRQDGLSTNLTWWSNFAVDGFWTIFENIFFLNVLKKEHMWN